MHSRPVTLIAILQFVIQLLFVWFMIPLVHTQFLDPGGSITPPIQAQFDMHERFAGLMEKPAAQLQFLEPTGNSARFESEQFYVHYIVSRSRNSSPLQCSTHCGVILRFLRSLKNVSGLHRQPVHVVMKFKLPLQTHILCENEDAVKPSKFPGPYI